MHETAQRAAATVGEQRGVPLVVRMMGVYGVVCATVHGGVAGSVYGFYESVHYQQ